MCEIAAAITASECRNQRTYDGLNKKKNNKKKTTQVYENFIDKYEHTHTSMHIHAVFHLNAIK